MDQKDGMIIKFKNALENEYNLEYNYDFLNGESEKSLETNPFWISSDSLKKSFIDEIRGMKPAATQKDKRHRTKIYCLTNGIYYDDDQGQTWGRATFKRNKKRNCVDEGQSRKSCELHRK